MKVERVEKIINITKIEIKILNKLKTITKLITPAVRNNYNKGIFFLEYTYQKF